MDLNSPEFHFFDIHGEAVSDAAIAILSRPLPVSVA